MIIYIHTVLNIDDILAGLDCNVIYYGDGWAPYGRISSYEITFNNTESIALFLFKHSDARIFDYTDCDVYHIT